MPIAAQANVDSMLKLKTITHYCEDDTDFASDSTHIEIFLNGKLYKHLEGSYDGSGPEWADGFKEGIKASGIECEIEFEKIADYPV